MSLPSHAVTDLPNAQRSGAVDPAFWAGRRVLLTGHTGFKGAWLAIWLHRLGARVVGISLPPATQPALFGLGRVGDLLDSRIVDICDAPAVAAHVGEVDPDIVFHLAAQALVHPSYRDPLKTFATNVQGTANVLNALRGRAAVRVVVAVTTDKVYRNREWAYPYREDDALGGHDPYSASKAASESAVASYRDAFLAAQGVTVASARAGNVIGGGDWSRDRLIPDAVRAWTSGQILTVRRPAATRPWQHVLEPLAGYLTLAQCLWSEPGLAGAWNFGPQSHEALSVRELIELAAGAWEGAQVEIREAPDAGPHEAGWLALEVVKARQMLGVRPRWTVETAVQRTMAWYRNVAGGADARAHCEADIAAYEAVLA